MNIKLSDYSRKFGVTYRTAWNRYKKGKIDGAYLDSTGHVVIPFDFNSKQENNCGLYSRVSNNNRKDSLDSQLERLRQFATANGYVIKYEIKEIGSGLNDNRPKLNKLLVKNDWNILIVENKDRLTRFGFNYIKLLLEKDNKKLIVINDTNSDKEDLLKDLTSVIYSFCARLYGLRRIKNKKDKILEILKSE